MFYKFPIINYAIYVNKKEHVQYFRKLNCTPSYILFISVQLLWDVIRYTFKTEKKYFIPCYLLLPVPLLMINRASEMKQTFTLLRNAPVCPAEYYPKIYYLLKIVIWHQTWGQLCSGIRPKFEFEINLKILKEMSLDYQRTLI